MASLHTMRWPLLLSAAAMPLSAWTAQVVSGAADYPHKAIRILTSEPGGSTDFLSRLIGSGISHAVGQPVVIDNRAGIIAIETAAKALPDGYTLLHYGQVIWIMPFMQDKATYDPVRDFAPITLVVSSPNILVVHPSVAANSVKELIDLAKARPGEINYSSAPAGASNHLAAELFRSMAGINIVRIPYKGTAPALTGLVSGQTQMMLPTALASMPHLKAGRLRALAVTTAQPSVLAPGLPTVSASGLPGYESVSSLGMLAPAKTPSAIIARLNQESVRAINQPDVRDKFLAAGATPVGSTPAEFAAVIKREMISMGKIIKDGAIKAE
jgi:tripartite-type tricarboxylate transporter receptor subunit TctC